MSHTMTDVPGIGPATADALAEHRIKTPRALANASLQKIAAIPGFSEARAAKVKAAAAALLAGQAIAAPTAKEGAPEESPEPAGVESGEDDGNKDKKDKKRKKEKKEKKEKKDKKRKKGKKNKKNKKN